MLQSLRGADIHPGSGAEAALANGKYSHGGRSSLMHHQFFFGFGFYRRLDTSSSEKNSRIEGRVGDDPVLVLLLSCRFQNIKQRATGACAWLATIQNSTGALLEKASPLEASADEAGVSESSFQTQSRSRKR